MSTPFTYQPLTDPGEIRVFILEPAPSREAALKGSFQHIVLPDQFFTDQYVALSYVWGDPAPADTIFVSGHGIGITANLGAALRDIRNAARVIHVWIDALCIDQRNIPERNRQVALMRDIYSSASSTIIYLGLLTPDVEFVLSQVPGRMFGELDDIHPPPSHQRKTVGEPPQEDQDINAATRSLVARPWFRRAWTFQELVLSRDPWVQCGIRKVRWMDLCKFLGPLLRTASGTRSILTQMNEIHDAVYTRSNVDPNILSFWQLLKLRGESQATDVRDLIYANMGLHSDRHEVGEFVKIDYNKSPGEVFLDVGHYARRHAGLEVVLSNISKSPLRSILPSWVPDWGFDVPLKLVGDEKAKMSYSSPSASKQDLLVLGFTIPPLTVTHLSDLLPAPRPTSNTRLRGVADMKGTPMSASSVRERYLRYGHMLEDLWEEFVWLRGVVEQGGRQQIDWLENIDQFDASALIVGYYNKEIHHQGFRYRLALLSNMEVTIVTDDVCVGDTIVFPTDASLSEGRRPHTSMSDSYPPIVIRQLKDSTVPRSDAIAKLLSMYSHYEVVQHCHLIGLQKLQLGVKETHAKPTLLIVH